MRRSTIETVRFRLLVGTTFLTFFTSAAEFERLESALKTGKTEWFQLTTRSNEQVELRLSQVLMIERLKHKSGPLSDGTIPIKQLAEFAGVHPITITRLFSSTLKQASEGSRKFRRATKETAVALRRHLVANGKSKVPTERQFSELFEGKG